MCLEEKWNNDDRHQSKAQSSLVAQARRPRLGEKKTMIPARHKVADAFWFMFLAIIVLLLAWMCSRTTAIRPKESDCLSSLQATTRKDTNYTQDELVSYGRCMEDSQ